MPSRYLTATLMGLSVKFLSLMYLFGLKIASTISLPALLFSGFISTLLVSWVAYARETERANDKTMASSFIFMMNFTFYDALMVMDA